MLAWRALQFRRLLLAAISFSLMGQASGGRYEPLKRALGLNGCAQTWHLEQNQQAKLAQIAKVLQRSQTSAGAVVLGLMDVREWPWGWACPLYPVGAYAEEFGLSDAQVRQFKLLEEAARRPILEQEWAKQKRHRELLESGASLDSPEVTQLAAEISKLMDRAAAMRPPHDAALAVLTDAQRAKFSAFQADSELAREAVELRLIPAPPRVEALCH